MPSARLASNTALTEWDHRVRSQRGITEGITKGITEGITKGITKGITEGITEGITDPDHSWVPPRPTQT